MNHEIEKLFEDCHSSVETPLMGRIFDPPCRTCSNLICPKDLFEPNTCKAFGKLPKEIYLSDGAQCAHYMPK